MLAAGIDTVVLGCTHYPFVFPLIEEIVGPEVRLIDPSPAIARQVGRLLEQFDLLNSSQKTGETRYQTTGDAAQLEKMLPVLGFAGEVEGVKWGKDLS
jgi:glutamate racemase